jgi:WD40 repeat protein
MTPDGKLLVSGAADRRIILWDIATAEQLFVSEPQTAAVEAVAITDDGRFMAQSTEGRVYLWDIAKRQIIRTYAGHSSDIRQLQFTANGRTLLSSSRDGTVRLWRVEPLADLVAWVKSSRYLPATTCAQEQLYGLEQSHC